MAQTASSSAASHGGLRRILGRAAVLLVFIALLLGVATGTWLYWRAHACLPQMGGSISLPGLSAPVKVLRDARGVPHLRAHWLEDLLFAQGYVTAQDRLWQMDLSRRLAFGELAEILGEQALRYDIENRTLGLRQVCERAVTELDAESRRLLQAYARGVNAFVASQRHRLPIEFWLLDYEPQPWREIDSLAVAANMLKLLNTTWHYDLMRERIRTKLPADLYADLFPDRSPLDQPVAQPVCGSTHRQAGSSHLAIPADTHQPLLSFSPPETLAPACLGSNNWVASGAHTQSGKPLLANDPHLPHGVPCAWYMIHLKSPEVNVAGVSLPGLPLVIIGHNERIAWGMTSTVPDVQDLYIETFDPHDPEKYRYRGEWRQAETREEVIRVRKSRDYAFRVKATRHGPIVSNDGNRDLALRWTAFEPGALQFPFLILNQAGCWRDFTAALRGFMGPMQNLVYADIDGNIGYYAAGRVPIRRQGDGTVPVRGDTDDHEWVGTIPFEHLPHAYNPASGFIATANGRVVPDEYPYLITRLWDAPYRTARLFALLRSGNQYTVADMLRMQNDVLPLDAVWLKERLLQAARRYPPSSADAGYALDILKAWDGQARVDSAATLICETSKRVLLERIVKPKLGEDLAGYHWPMSTVFLQNVLESRWGRWLPPGDRDFDETLMKTLAQAIQRIAAGAGRCGPAAWKWGETIPLTFRHPLSGGFPFSARLLDVGPFPEAGTSTTVKQTSPTIGPSMRMVVDLLNFDASVQNITLGQSGQPFSPHYSDQFEAWYSGRSFPLPFSDSAVDRAAVHKLVLEPK